MAPRSYDPELLLAEDGFLRRLARSLVEDPGHADDLVQQAWLGALRRRAAPTRLHSWLAAAVHNLASKLRRGEERRGRRELWAARPEAIPSPAEILEREGARRAVVVAVMELDEPSRDALILRYFDDLPPRLVAQRLGVPVETARTRIKRALERLRERFDREHGGDRARWALALGPLAQGPAVLASWMGVLEMSRRTLVAGGALLSVVLCGVALIWWPGVATPEDGPGQAPIAAPAASRSAPPEALSSRPARVAVQPEEQSRTGSVRVQALWGDDRTPAEGTTVRLVQWQDPGVGWASTDREAVTGADGTVVFTDLLPWKTSLYEVRGGDCSVMVQPGRCVDAVLEIPPGVLVRGTVVAPDDTPVAGAVVEASDSQMLVPVAVTASDGTFAVRSGSSPYLGARARGHAPSFRQRAGGLPGQTRQVRFVLAPACELHGLVLGADGAPVAKATVQVGSDRPAVVRLENGEQGVCAPARTVTTDAEGRFQIAVRAEVVELGVTAPRYAPCFDWARVLVGVRNEKTLTLRRGITLRGRVTDGTGAPVSVAWVGVTRQQHQRFGAVRTRVAADGSFELEHVTRHPQFDAWARAADGRTARRPLSETSDGDEVRWDPVLAVGPQLRGLVVDEAGAPLSGWSVGAQAEVDRQPLDSTTTQADGRFVIQASRDVQCVLFVGEPKESHFPAVLVPGVRPGPSEVRIEVPVERRATARITGCIVDSRGAGLGAIRVGVWRNDLTGAPLLTTAAGTGRFAIAPVPPGKYRLHVQHPDWPELLTEERHMQSGETWDLGNLTLPDPGSLLVVLPPGDLTRFHNRSLHLIDVPRRLTVDLGIQGNRARSRPLAPSNYRLQVEATGAAWKILPFTIQSGVETRLELTFEPGIHRLVRIVPPPGALPETEWQLTVQGRDGATVFQSPGGLTAKSCLQRLCLAPGTYRLLLTSAGGARGEATFEVPDAPAESGEVQVEFR